MTSPSDPNAAIDVTPEILHATLQEFLLVEGENVSLDLDNLLLTVLALRARVASLEASTPGS